MSFWSQLLAILAAIALIFWILSIIRRNPGSFTAHNINKSLTTLGVLALLLIGFIAILVFYLRHSS